MARDAGFDIRTWCVGGLLLLGLVSSAPAEGKRIALTVGVEHYDPDVFGSLNFAEDDALDLERVLTGLGFDVISMTSQATIPARKPGTPMKILDQLDRRLKNRDTDDTVLVFLSGHGIQLKSDPVAEDGSRETYFCPEEANPGDRLTLLPLSVVMRKLANSKVERKLLLVDACRNDMVPKNSRKGHAELPPVLVERPPVPKGMMALFSCSPTETSHEFAELGHGVFTNCLLDYLKGEAAGARYPRQELRVTELASYVSRETGDYLDRKLGKSQSPQLIVPGGISDWPLGKIPRRAEPPPLLMAPFSSIQAQRAQGAWSERLGTPVVLKNSLGMELAIIPAGEFQMGATKLEEVLAKVRGHRIDEEIKASQPPHSVRITKPFYIGVHEVTKRQFNAFVIDQGYTTAAESSGSKATWLNPSFPQADDHPVVNVDAGDAIAFADWLSRKEGKSYRLPTEAEWEYACRAGTTTVFQHGNDLVGLANVGNVADQTLVEKSPNYNGISAKDGFMFTAPVGQFRPNAFGLHDLHGNVYEWCNDWFQNYRSGLHTDPQGPSTGVSRVARGGAWNFSEACMSAFRVECPSCLVNDVLGFRVALSPSVD